MTVTTDTPTQAAVAPHGAQEKAAALVAELRERLHAAARSGKLTDDHAHGILFGLVAANAVLDPARALVLFARAIEHEAHQRRTDPGQDCGNPMGQPNVPSCAELVLAKHEDIAAERLVHDLQHGPWPLY